MKVLFLSRLYYPHVGGVEKHIALVSKELKKRGYYIQIITEKFDKKLRSREKVSGVTVSRFFYPKIKVLGLFVIWYRLWKLRHLIRESDIVHCHDVFIWYLPFRFLFPRKPVYVTFHGWEGMYPVPKRFILLNRIAAKLSRGNLCAGKFIEKYYGIKANKIYYTAINPSKSENFKKDKKNIVYVGRLDEDTGLRLILKGLSRLKGYNIEFCGDGLLRDECLKIGRVWGFVDPNKYYKKAYVCVSAGLTSILEAISYNCLVVTMYNNPLKRDYLLMTPFKRWIFASRDPNKMAETIKYYSVHPKEVKNNIYEARMWVRSQSWSFVAGLYEELWSL